jgi:hypothetical protein
MVPVDPAGDDLTAGACIPDDLARDLGRLIAENLARRGNAAFEPSRGNEPPTVGNRLPVCDPDERFVDFSAFGWYSPLPYASQAVVIAPARWVGIGTTGLILLARLANLAVYLALVFVAIRRSPFARWGLAAAALVPVALFQAASSRSPDAVTIGVAMLVLVSALRAVQGGTDRVTGSPLAERVVLALLLGILKPSYAVIGLIFLLPLGVRGRRDDPDRESLRTMLVPAAVAIGASVAWQSFAGHYFTCDTVFFGMEPDPGRQIDHIFSAPFDYAWAVLESLWNDAGKYFDEFATVGVTVANWAWWGIAAVLVAVVLAGSKDDTSERFELGASQRGLLLALVFVGMVIVITGEHVYCAQVGETDIVYPPHARHFLPVLPLLAVALTPSRTGTRRQSFWTRIPAAALLSGVTAAFVLGTALEMR